MAAKRRSSSSKIRRAQQGRPSIELPGNLSPRVHEARRLALGLSRRGYAATIGVPQGTYIRKTQHIRIPRKPHAQKKDAGLDFLSVAREFIRRKPRFIASLKDELKIAEQAVVDAKARVAEIRKILTWFEKNA